jgi:hypothetical protein
VINEATVSQWLDSYVSAWKSYDPQEIGRLFSPDALYNYTPYTEPLRGREAIVADWLKNRDEPGTYDGQYHPVAIQGDLAVANGRSLYYAKDETNVAREFDNIFVIRFNDAGECTEFREWYMQKKIE